MGTCGARHSQDSRESVWRRSVLGWIPKCPGVGAKVSGFRATCTCVLQAGGRIHGVFLLGREERVFNLGTPGPSDRMNSSDTDFEGQIWNRQSGHSGTGCVFERARWRATRIPGRTPHRRCTLLVSERRANQRLNSPLEWRL